MKTDRTNSSQTTITSLLLLGCMLVSTISCNPPESGSGEDALSYGSGSSASFELCADFSLFPDDTFFTSPFTLSGMIFSSSGTLFVNQSGGDAGLQFEDIGMNVQLPSLASEVRLVIGVFNSDVLIEAMDPSNNVVASQSVPQNNAFISVQLTGANIKNVRFSGGGNEGVLQSICYDVVC